MSSTRFARRVEPSTAAPIRSRFCLHWHVASSATCRFPANRFSDPHVIHARWCSCPRASHARRHASMQDDRASVSIARPGPR